MIARFRSSGVDARRVLGWPRQIRALQRLLDLPGNVDASSREFVISFWILSGRARQRLKTLGPSCPASSLSTMATSVRRRRLTTIRQVAPTSRRST
jgi:hypothetical protein